MRIFQGHVLYTRGEGVICVTINGFVFHRKNNILLEYKLPHVEEELYM